VVDRQEPNVGDDAFAMFTETEIDPLPPEYCDQLDATVEAHAEAERLFPFLADTSPWTLIGDSAFDHLRYQRSGEVLAGITDDSLTLRLTRLRGIEHLGVYASSYPGREPKHRLPEGPFTLDEVAVIREWSHWFGRIARRALVDPDDWPGYHALPPERGFYTVRKVYKAISQLSPDLF
jgi:hypothetical protein